jgi:ABC-type branched-subunit amino acid transport system ATPase component
MKENSHILETRELVAGYGKIVIVDHVSIDLKEGEVVAILGPNGSGKSTLVKSIMGLVKVFDGEILYKGSKLNGLRVDKIVKMGVSYVPQVDNIFPSLTVEENLEMGAYVRKKDESLQADLESIFQTFPELKPYRKRLAGTLSGGERQMLAIARAMMVKPKLLILDEPTANLAPKVVLSLHKKIQEINNLGLSILMVEQNAKKALEIANRAFVLVSGQCIYGGSSQELRDVDLGSLFLGTKRLSSNKPAV